MAAPVKKLGTGGGVKTGVTTEIADKNGKTFTFEGTIAELEQMSLAGKIPDDFAPVRSVLAPTGGGMGILTVSCVKYEAGTLDDWAAERTVIEIEMEEVTYDLVDHPHLDQCRMLCRKWLATDEAKRVDDNEKYYYTDESGAPVEIVDATALEFCKAYMAGIKSFVRYFPVIVRNSIYKNPPGLTRSERSFTGGSPKFSSDCGRFSTPPVSLSGYASTNWFKGGDRWRERGDTTWELQEKWTYTPDGSTGPHAWIYTAPTSQNGNQQANQQGGGS